MKEYFGKGICCIYLDQFTTSNLFDAPSSEIWVKIRDLLLEKHRQGKVICPVPFEHMLESANKHQERAFTIDRNFGMLSNGFAFLPEAEVASNYIVCLIRNLPVKLDVFCGQLRHRETLSQTDAFDGFKSKHGTLKGQVDDIAVVHNELREVLARRKFPRTTMEPLFHALKLMQVQVLFKRLDDLISKGQIISEAETINGEQVIKWTDLLLQLLIFKHKLTRPEGIGLQKLLSESGFDEIPPMDIRWSLSANIVIEHKKQTVNDQIDIMRLSTGLPVADLLFTDKQRKNELEQTHLAKKYKTEIFSGTPWDLQRFYDRLKEI